MIAAPQWPPALNLIVYSHGTRWNPQLQTFNSNEPSGYIYQQLASLRNAGAWWLYLIVGWDGAASFLELRDRNYRLIKRSTDTWQFNANSQNIAFGKSPNTKAYDFLNGQIDFAETFFEVNGVVTSPWSL